MSDFNATEGQNLDTYDQFMKIVIVAAIALPVAGLCVIGRKLYKCCSKRKTRRFFNKKK